MKDTKQTHPHPVTELCADGERLYASALSAGRISRSEAEGAPCLLEFALLHPDPDDANWLQPVPPSVVLAQRLQPIEREIQERRRLSVDLTAAFEPFMAISTQMPPTTHAITVLEGVSRINAALDKAITESHTEVLTVQPGGGRSEHLLSEALQRSKPLIERGISMRTLYQHTVRYSQNTFAYVDKMAGARVEIRTLEELIERLIICDHDVAFIPAQAGDDMALELRHPGLVQYLINVFDQLWRRATPLQDDVQYEATVEGITGVQRSIAKLLIEGHVDEAIARRLGMNVRTCRAHIAKIAAALGSGSRAQLGYLIAQSGMLERES
ncbi:helix-turn-helix transcriptional regulator [Streptomyces beihaiensis]|uniref:Helix-turn-helix transcriptional regulator n=1 Tax=Streptomyces beihaiensis TaxID=2984495 RepID=A0ABT3TVQ2_9ACTN|nr:helix-turn-helix transcriptional regulator [Streptomyces beihaiensis]MCX3060462.1 helix-turn-helix transcriptional regulator [Streptomyces beihaiensis]